MHKYFTSRWGRRAICDTGKLQRPRRPRRGGAASILGPPRCAMRFCQHFYLRIAGMYCQPWSSMLILNNRFGNPKINSRNHSTDSIKCLFWEKKENKFFITSMYSPLEYRMFRFTDWCFFIIKKFRSMIIVVIIISLVLLLLLRFQFVLIFEYDKYRIIAIRQSNKHI